MGEQQLRHARRSRNGCWQLDGHEPDGARPQSIEHPGGHAPLQQLLQHDAFGCARHEWSQHDPHEPRLVHSLHDGPESDHIAQPFSIALHADVPAVVATHAQFRHHGHHHGRLRDYDSEPAIQPYDAVEFSPRAKPNAIWPI